MIQKLRWKFVLINMLIVTAILVSIGTVMVVSTRDSLRKDSINLLRQAVSEDFALSWPLTPNDDRGFSFEEEDVSLPYFTVAVGVDGTTFLLDNQFGTIDEDELVDVVALCLAEQSDMGLLRSYGLRYMRVSTRTGWRIAFADISQERSTLRSLYITLLFISLGALAAFFVLSLLLARWAVRPVERSWAQQRQFVSDASHELKTPLSVIVSNVDMLQECGESLNDRELRWLDNIRASSDQMTYLVEELLTLARAENDQSGKELVKEAVPLSDLVTDEALLFEPILYEAGKELDDHITENLLVTGDPGKLRRLVNILLDNARKYADSPSVVSLRLEPEGTKRVRLTVNTKGEPIPHDQLERIFERFYRADQARASEGFGLGLSIASQIAQEHGGRLWAESSPDEGNTFLFSMPRLREENKVLAGHTSY
ncbi:MAG: HAMP domain-containing histidine kinase [Clostridiales bacterium]|nr:HAMP domain-containing histidine kinase [Clostridiales bacterium]